jgi:recombinational DNA repair protein RecT
MQRKREKILSYTLLKIACAADKSPRVKSAYSSLEKLQSCMQTNGQCSSYRKTNPTASSTDDSIVSAMIVVPALALDPDGALTVLYD